MNLARLRPRALKRETLLTGAAEIGQGSSTVLMQIAAEVIGVGPERFRVVAADSAITPKDNGSYSSRVTLYVGNAALRAAEQMRDLLWRAAARSFVSQRKRRLCSTRPRARETTVRRNQLIPDASAMLNTRSVTCKDRNHQAGRRSARRRPRAFWSGRARPRPGRRSSQAGVFHQRGQILNARRPRTPQITGARPHPRAGPWHDEEPARCIARLARPPRSLSPKASSTVVNTPSGPVHYFEAAFFRTAVRVLGFGVALFLVAAFLRFVAADFRAVAFFAADLDVLVFFATGFVAAGFSLLIGPFLLADVVFFIAFVRATGFFLLAFFVDALALPVMRLRRAAGVVSSLSAPAPMSRSMPKTEDTSSVFKMRPRPF